VESLEWAAHIIPAVKADGIISIVHCMWVSSLNYICVHSHWTS
jgi:hypothetical protein